MFFCTNDNLKLVWLNIVVARRTGKNWTRATRTKINPSCLLDFFSLLAQDLLLQQQLPIRQVQIHRLGSVNAWNCELNVRWNIVGMAMKQIAISFSLRRIERSSQTQADKDKGSVGKRNLIDVFRMSPRYNVSCVNFCDSCEKWRVRELSLRLPNA